jgi:hypothetical protein
MSRLAARGRIRYKTGPSLVRSPFCSALEVIMLRRAMLAAVASLFCFGTRALPAQEQTSSSLGKAAGTTFKKTLEAGLRARRPQEFAFIARVVTLVENGTLPRSLVESTFFWARRQGRYPVLYFEAGLRLRAKRIGVML